MNHSSKNIGIVSLWAVAECGIGGIMHGLKIPFTGIIVGSISAMCLYFIAKNSERKRQSIIEATATVLMIKLIASPHSPWQAYIAVSFQAMMAVVFLTGKSISTTKVYVFTIITQLESALQRILIMVLIFGSNFISALEKSIQMLLTWLGMPSQSNIIWFAFIAYTAMHLITGILLGFWLPGLEKEVINMQEQNIKVTIQKNEIKIKNQYKIWGMAILTLTIPLLLAWLLNDKSLFFVFFRVLMITITFIFILTPSIKFLIKKFSKKNADNRTVDQLLTQLPTLIDNYISYASWANAKYTGFAKMKYILVALLYASTQYSKNE